MIEEKEKITIKLSLKGKVGDQHRIAVRFYVLPTQEGERGEETYIYTDYKILKKDWNAKRQAEDLFNLKQKLYAKIRECKEKCGSDLTAERFRCAWLGEKISNRPTLLDLLDKHLEFESKGLLKQNKNGKRYSKATKDMYQEHRRLLERIHNGVPEKNLPPQPLFCDQFTTKLAFRELENHVRNYAAKGMGNTRVSMVMTKIKAICDTGNDPEFGLNWITTNAFDRYSKPDEDQGTEPIEPEDLHKIMDYRAALTNGSDPHKLMQESSFIFGRDFWCFMVLAGGMEAKDIALLKWSKVNEIMGYFSYTRSKIEDNAEGDIMISYTDFEHLKHVIKTYGLEENKATGGYVFDILKEGMNEDQIDKAVQSFYSRITKIMHRLSEQLGITPLATCKRARPTFACFALANKVDIYTISRMMGHKNLKTTEIYLSKLPTRIRLKFSKEIAAIFKQAA